jgi:hypothetical protein
MIDDNFASRAWLLFHLSQMKRELVRLKANVSPSGRWRKQNERKKPWPRKSGLTTASGAPAMWRA